jgi:hypothetical protein
MKPEFKGVHPESARLDRPGQLSLRFRLERISVGATEFIPPLFAVGASDEERAFFSLEYMIAGSIGSAVSERCDYQIEFDGATNVGEAGQRQDDLELMKYGRVIFEDLLLER